MTAFPNSMVDLIDDLISDARHGVFTLPEFRRKTEVTEVWYDLAFCIVSSQERTNRALAAANCLGAGYFRLMGSDDIPSAIADLFQESYISLRFINRKTQQLADSFQVLQNKRDYILDIATNFNTAYAAREFLMEHFPGIGPKQASMFLRNIGFGTDLAIIDSHIEKMSRILIPQIYMSRKPNYADIEAELRQFADSRSVNLQTLDVILWSCSRLMGKRRLEEPLLV